MTSIRTKLFFNISFLLVFFVLAAWGLSAVFLDDFYVWNKKRNLVDSGRMIAALHAAGEENISLELERVADSLGAGIIIVGRDGELKYASFERLAASHRGGERPPRNGRFAPDAPPPAPAIMVTVREEIDGDTVLERQHDQPLGVDFLMLRRRLANGDELLMRLPLAAVTESTAYASRFMAFSGLLSIMAGCTWAYFFARKFTVPLRQLSDVAAAIARLDFSQRCCIESDDEVGRLGESINNLSRQLSKAINDLSEKNRRLMADVEKERKLDKLRKDFISSVSHELKTPLSLILGYAEGLRENVARSRAEREYYCGVIADEAGKMDRLVNDLLDLSRIESGHFRLERSDFDLAALLGEVAQKYRAILREKDLFLQLEMAPAIPVNGDPFRIEQIILNLLNNAIIHGDEGSPIRIAAAAVADKIRVSVSNAGRHIPSESMGNLWLSFYKADPARTRGHGGHGLGLSIVRAIQERHGNAYGVENVAGGVMFWFDIDQINSGSR